MAELRHRSVADLMERDCPTVPGYLSVRDFVDEYLLHSASHWFFVVSNRHVIGLVTSSETRKVPRDTWEQTSVQSIMQSLDQIRSIPPEMPAIEALEIMNRENVRHLAVMSLGGLQGLFSHRQVLRFLQIHSEAKAKPAREKAA
jgi:signal-transduction protein with cAMP-binding, CBS, and nucleotidyltransferase domain